MGQDLVFVVSTPRAGSTLLGAMLGSHSSMFCPPEPWLLLPLAAMRSESVPSTAVFNHSLAREAIGQLAEPDLLDEGERAMVRTIYGRLAERAGKRIFVDKTPRYYQILPWLEAMFPQAKLIWLNRNPLDILASLRDTWQIPLEELLGAQVTPYTFDCTLSLQMLADHFGADSPRRSVVSYEELVHDPRKHVERLCTFIGVDFEPAMLEYGSNEKLISQYSTRRMGDKKILSHGRPHEQSLDRWKQKFSAEELSRIVRTLGPGIFQRLGYGAAFDTACAIAGVEKESIDPDGELPRIAAMYRAYQGSHDLAVRLSRLEAELEVCEADRAKRLELIQVLTQQIDGIEADRRQRLDVIEALSAERERLRAQLEEATTQCVAREQVIQRQGAQISEIEADRSARLRLLESANGELLRLQEGHQALTQQRDALAQQRDALAQQRDALAQQHDSLAQQHDSLAQERQTLSQQCVTLTQQCEALTHQCEALTQQYQALRAQHEALQVQQSDQAIQMQRLDEKLRAAQAALEAPAARALRRLKLLTYEPTNDVP